MKTNPTQCFTKKNEFGFALFGGAFSRRTRYLPFICLWEALGDGAWLSAYPGLAYGIGFIHHISGAELKPEHHNLRTEDIYFSYAQKPIIDSITLDIPERTTTAIVGPSGGGKTTLCHLLSRFWDVNKGTVRLGGHDVREYDMDSLMENFSFVFQNVYLFHDTIANNIRFGQPDAPIIILDEATANVDPENEKELREAISELTHEKTVIMIAHRLKTVRHADQILVVDKGRIVQRGTHDELMEQEGIYRRFISGRERAIGWKL